jgi:DNA-binding transcriptional LysR family regulator
MDRLINMKTFVKVVEAGSFAEAGRRSHLSKAVVSKRINQLEELLGVGLLQRSTRSLSVTDRRPRL